MAKSVTLNKIIFDTTFCFRIKPPYVTRDEPDVEAGHQRTPEINLNG